jgi:hypothetical protein
MNFSYLSWVWRYRVWYPISRIRFVSNWAKPSNVRYAVKSFLYPLFNHGVQYFERWDMMHPISERFLRASWHLMHNLNGTPMSMFPEDYDHMAGGYDEAIDGPISAAASQKWKDTLKEIRFPFFWTIFIDGDPFGWMIETPEDRKNCYLWARKKYPWALDHLNWRFFKTMYPDESIVWKTNMITTPVPDKSGLFSISFSYTNRVTGETKDDLVFKKIHASFDHAQATRERYEKGMELFAKHFQSLWD